METTITRTLKGSDMEKIFQKESSIRYYTPVYNSESYDRKLPHEFNIVIRYAEEESADILFNTFLDQLQKPKRVPKKKTFLVVTELGRVKGKISFYISEVDPNVGLKLINNDHQCSTRMNIGVRGEAVAALVKYGALPEKALRLDGYPNSKYDKYNLILVDGQGINYVS